MSHAALLLSLACADYDRCPESVQARARAAAVLVADAAPEGAPPLLLASLVWHESGLRSDAASRVEAVGLAQLNPRRDAPAMCRDEHTRRWRNYARHNVRCGARILARLLRRCGGAWEWAITAYNRGGACARSEWARRVVEAAKGTR